VTVGQQGYCVRNRVLYVSSQNSANPKYKKNISPVSLRGNKVLVKLLQVSRNKGDNNTASYCFSFISRTSEESNYFTKRNKNF